MFIFLYGDRIVPLSVYSLGLSSWGVNPNSSSDTEKGTELFDPFPSLDFFSHESEQNL